MALVLVGPLLAVAMDPDLPAAMSIPQRIDPYPDERALCDLAVKWRIDPQLAVRLVILARLVPFEISIISGWRSIEHQLQYDLDPSLSTHTSCPVATGADLQIHVAVTNVTKATLGEAAFRAGLRWGGGAPTDDSGIPIKNEWAHVDLGPRQQ